VDNTKSVSKRTLAKEEKRRGKNRARKGGEGGTGICTEVFGRAKKQSQKRGKPESVNNFSERTGKGRFTDIATRRGV